MSKLKERIEVLEKLNKKMEKENMKLKKQNEELETLNRELERQNRELEKQYSNLLGLLRLKLSIDKEYLLLHLSKKCCTNAYIWLSANPGQKHNRC